MRFAKILVAKQIDGLGRVVGCTGMVASVSRIPMKRNSWFECCFIFGGGGFNGRMVCIQCLLGFELASRCGGWRKERSKSFRPEAERHHPRTDAADYRDDGRHATVEITRVN